PELFEIFRIYGVNAREYHRLHFFKALDGFLAGAGGMGNRIAHFHLARLLDARNDIAHVTCTDYLLRHLAEFQRTDLIGNVLFARGDELHLVALPYLAILHLEVGHDAPEGIINGVKYQRL